jgi:hypothetical protein
MPKLLALRDSLYSDEFRAFIEHVTNSGPLSDRVDCAANVYMQGSHLLTHDDVISTRKVGRHTLQCYLTISSYQNVYMQVSYIIYLSEPDDGWKKEDGGALEVCVCWLVRDGCIYVLFLSNTRNYFKINNNTLLVLYAASDVWLGKWCERNAREYSERDGAAELEHDGHVCGGAGRELPLGARGVCAEQMAHIDPGLVSCGQRSTRRASGIDSPIDRRRQGRARLCSLVVSNTRFLSLANHHHHCRRRRRRRRRR